jgi:hypothetical protein
MSAQGRYLRNGGSRWGYQGLVAGWAACRKLLQQQLLPLLLVR